MKHANRLLAALLMTGGLAGTIYAVHVNASDDVEPKMAMNAKVTLTDAIDIALENVPGMPIGVDLEYENDIMFWDVEILDDSQQVFEVEIDATSGDVLKQHIENDDEKDD